MDVFDNGCLCEEATQKGLDNLKAANISLPSMIVIDAKRTFFLVNPGITM